MFSIDVQKSIFLKSGQLITGLTKAFLGVGEDQKELSFSDHTHNLPDLDGILTADKGGTGVSSLDELKTTLGVSGSQPVYVTRAVNGVFNIPAGAIAYIIFGPVGSQNQMLVEIGGIGASAVLSCNYNSSTSKMHSRSNNFNTSSVKWWTSDQFPNGSYGVFFYA